MNNIIFSYCVHTCTLYTNVGQNNNVVFSKLLMKHDTTVRTFS